MKKQLFSLHEATADALDKYKTDGRGDKSAFVDALIARELGVELPESAVDRKVALEAAAPAEPEAPAEPVTAASVLNPGIPDVMSQAIQDASKEPAPSTGFGEPVKPAASTAFEEVLANRRAAASDRNPETPELKQPVPQSAAGFVAAAPITPAEAETLPPALQSAAPIVSAAAAAATADPAGMNIVEPVQSNNLPEQPEPTANGSERKCPTCGELFDTPFCLNCL